MAEFRSPSEVQKRVGLLSSLVQQARLVWRLLRDARVPGWVKLIPAAGLAYLVSPVDLIPALMLPVVGDLDDVAVILLSLKAFVDLCPPAVVREHLSALSGHRWEEAGDGPTSDPYLDVPYSVSGAREPDLKKKPE